MMDLEKFEREELPRIKENRLTWLNVTKGDIPYPISGEIDDLILAFESAMLALREERERCVKIAEDHSIMHRPLVPDFAEGFERACKIIAEEIRKSDNSDSERSDEGA